MQFHREALVDRIERQAHVAVQAGHLNSLQAKQIRNTYAAGLNELTYLDIPISKPPPKTRKRPMPTELGKAAPQSMRRKPKAAGATRRSAVK